MAPAGSRVPQTVAAARKRRHLLHTAARIAAVPVLVAALVVVHVDGAPAIPSPATALAAGTCTGWPDDAVPPTTIRVLRTAGPATGTVQVVPFHDYVTVVMAAEWGPGNPPEALTAGAVAAKEYAWYYAMFWRGRSAADGSCYDVSDSSVDQVYSPETRVPAASIVTAVDASWGMTVRRNTGLFVTHYQAGSNVACGANADGGHLYQVSAAHCAQDGMTAEQILQTYYGPGVEISGGTAPAPYPVGLRFLAQPAGGTANVAFPVQPVVAIVDATGQTFVGDAASQPAVTLALGTPLPGVSLSCTGGLSSVAAAGVATFAGCTLNGSAPGAILVASAPGLAPASTAPFAVGIAPPTLTLSAPGGAITWGQGVQLTAALVPPGPEDPAGRTVHLQRSLDGVTWGPVADLVTDAQGTASVANRPAANTWYRLVFDGTPDMAATASPALRVLVRRVALLRPDRSGTVRRVARGTVIAFSTLVRPVQASVTPGPVEYRLYQLVSGSWVLKRSWTVTPDATGLAPLSVTFGTRGSWMVRSIAVPTTTNANSPWSPAQRYDVL